MEKPLNKYTIWLLALKLFYFHFLTVNHARHTTTMITPTTMNPTPTTTTTIPATTKTPAITNPILVTKKLNGITDDMVDVLIKAIGVIVDRAVKNQYGKKINNHFIFILQAKLQLEYH